MCVCVCKCVSVRTRVCSCMHADKCRCNTEIKGVVSGAGVAGDGEPADVHAGK